MTKLEELIKELCPNGVEYKTMGELGDFYGGLSGKSKDDFRDGNAKFITYRNVYSNPALNLDIEDRVKITEGEKQNTLQYGDIIFTGSSETPDECGFSSVITKPTTEKLFLNSFCFFFRLRDPKLMLPDFAKHLFRSENLREQIGRTASGVTRYNVSKDKMKKIVIPLPPLAVQCEIVRILDDFTLLSSELAAELAARRKQYEYYRDKLLSFDKLNARCAVNWLNAEEIFEIRNGYTPSKSNVDFWEDGTIPWFRLDDIRAQGRNLYSAFQNVTLEAVKGKKLIPKYSLILSTTATIGEHAIVEVDCLTNQQMTAFTLKEEYKNIISIKFLFY